MWDMSYNFLFDFFGAISFHSVDIFLQLVKFFLCGDIYNPEKKINIKKIKFGNFSKYILVYMHVSQVSYCY